MVSNYKIYRTYIDIYDRKKDKPVKISWFDLSNIYIKNGLCYIYFLDDSYLYLSSNNVHYLYKLIIQSIRNFYLDFRISDLIDETDTDIDTKCCICLEKLTNNISIKLNCCHHSIHLDCITNYWKQNNNIICPLCRNTNCPFCSGSNCPIHNL